MKDDFDRFSINVILDDEEDWVAHFVELPNISAFGETPEAAILELKVAWKTFKESYHKHKEELPIAPTKKEYSGHFNVRIDKRIHGKLAIEAARSGISLNALVAQKLSNIRDSDAKKAS